jgi:hypothetical protein
LLRGSEIFEDDARSGRSAYALSITLFHELFQAALKRS